LRTDLERLVGKFHDLFKTVSTVVALVLVQRHEAYLLLKRLRI
jgi:hypothetical protein